MRRFIPAVLLFSFFFIALPDAGRAETITGWVVALAEAEFYLGQCGVTGLDRNGDGVPCENLCR
jgi:hypothetical protein